jgi:hypothetical protein
VHCQAGTTSPRPLRPGSESVFTFGMHVTSDVEKIDDVPGLCRTKLRLFDLELIRTARWMNLWPSLKRTSCFKDMERALVQCIMVHSTSNVGHRVFSISKGKIGNLGGDALDEKQSYSFLAIVRVPPHFLVCLTPI